MNAAGNFLGSAHFPGTDAIEPSIVLIDARGTASASCFPESADGPVSAVPLRWF
jgi:hypothetical protein